MNVLLIAMVSFASQWFTCLVVAGVALTRNSYSTFDLVIRCSYSLDILLPTGSNYSGFTSGALLLPEATTSRKCWCSRAGANSSSPRWNGPWKWNRTDSAEERGVLQLRSNRRASARVQCVPCWRPAQREDVQDLLWRAPELLLDTLRPLLYLLHMCKEVCMLLIFCHGDPFRPLSQVYELEGKTVKGTLSCF